MGTGFRAGVFMKDIGVVNRPGGAPTLALTGGAAARLQAIIPAGHEAVVHLTLTDDHPLGASLRHHRGAPAVSEIIPPDHHQRGRRAVPAAPMHPPGQAASTCSASCAGWG